MPTNLTQLPREVRERIYDFVFHWEKVVPKITTTKRKTLGPETSSWGAAKDPNEILALLLVNHQISAEYKMNFYSHHTITGQPSDLISFLKGIGTRHGLVRAVEVQEAEIFTETLYKQSMPLLVRTLSELSSLRSIKLKMSKVTFEAAQLQLRQYGITQVGKRVTITIHNTSSVLRRDPSVSRYEQSFDRRIDMWTRPAGEEDWQDERGEEEFADLLVSSNKG